MDHSNHLEHQAHRSHTNHKNHDAHLEAKPPVRPDKKHEHSGHHEAMAADFLRRFFVSLALTVPILILSPLIQSLLGFKVEIAGAELILAALGSAIFFYGGLPFLRGTLDEIGKRKPAMMTLIALAITVSYSYSIAVAFGLEGEPFFFELATLIDIMLIGHYLEMKSVLGASRALESLARLLPDEAHLISEDSLLEVKISDLKPGDRILIKAGERIPADARLAKGEGYVDESMLTGESKPVKKIQDDKVMAGSVNGESVLEAIVSEVGEESYLNKVINLVKEAQEAKSKTHRLADRAATWLTFIAIATGSATFIFWALSKEPLAFAVERAATVMVIACPHALGLAVPLVSAISTAILAKNGLLVRDKAAFEEARRVTTLVFDKTGTLTEGSFKVRDVKPLKADQDEKRLLSLAATLEQNSEHPIAKGILNKAAEFDSPPLKVDDFEVIKGAGVQGVIEGKRVALVSRRYALEKALIDQASAFDWAATYAYIIMDDEPVGVITLSDKIRDESYGAVKRLQALGIKCWMLTGDNEMVAKAVSDQLALDGFFAEVSPHEKKIKIQELQGRGEIVAMTGDGINDAPALAQADVGIAIGSGTDVAAETADLILASSNPGDVLFLLSFSRKTYGKMLQNLFWATGYNIVAIPVAAGVLAGWNITLSPAVGAALMSLSTIIVAVNARLLK